MQRRRSIHYRRMVEDGKVYSQPFSEGGAAAAGTVAFGTKAKKVGDGWQINGKKIFASLSGHADYYGILCTEDREDASRRHTMFMAVPADAKGVEVVGDWDPLGMRGTVSRNLIFKDAHVDDDEALMPPGIYYQGVVRWPHMFLTLTPAYIGLMQGAYDFTVKYLRGEVPGMPPVKRRMYPDQADRGRADAHHAGADQDALVPRRCARRASIRARTSGCAPLPRNIRRWKTPTRWRSSRSAPAAASRC